MNLHMEGPVPARRWLSMAAIVGPLLAAFVVGAFLIGAKSARADDPFSPPVLTADLTSPPDGDPYLSGTWTNNNVKIDYDCTGVAPLSGPTDTTVSTIGTTNILTQHCSDKYGSDVTVGPFTIRIDKTKPTLSLVLKNADSTTYVPGTWTNQDVTADWTCSGFAGDVAPQDGPGPVDETISTEGKTTVADPADCMDEAGNVADEPPLPEIWIDKTKPELTYVLQDADAVTYAAPPHWTALTVYLVWICTDPDTNAMDISGVDQASVPADVTYDTTGQYPTPQDQTCMDEAGNESDEVDVAALQVWIDKTKPYLVVQFAKLKANGKDTSVPGAQVGPFVDGSLDDWWPYDVAVRVTCRDDHSGVASNTFSTPNIFFTQEGARQFILNGSCVDNVGNVADKPVGKSVKVDTVAPSCRMDSSARAKFGIATGIKIFVTGSDVTSGLKTAEVISISPLSNVTGPATPAPSGTQWMFTGAQGRTWKATGKVTDMAGNSRTCTHTISSRR